MCVGACWCTCMRVQKGVRGRVRALVLCMCVHSYEGARMSVCVRVRGSAFESSPMAQFWLSSWKSDARRATTCAGGCVRGWVGACRCIYMRVQKGARGKVRALVLCMCACV